MTVFLQKHHEDLLRDEVASGRFTSVDEALAFALDHFLPGDVDDLSWLRDDLDAARASVASGTQGSITDYRAKLQERLRKPGGA